MTIPSTGPRWHQPVRIAARRDRRPNALLAAAAVMTLGVLALAVSALLSGEPATPRQVALLGLLTSGIVSMLIAAVWLIHPRPLPPYVAHDDTPPVVADGGAVSPEHTRGAWPFARD